MKLQFPKAILFSTLLFACPSLMLAQEPPNSEPKLTQGEAESLLKELASQEEALEQSCHRSALIYREMAVSSESDSASTRQLKHQYEQLAENQERAASAAKRIASYHARLAVLIRQSSDSAKTRNILGDSAYRR
jgi:hypothetical protein